MVFASLSPAARVQDFMRDGGRGSGRGGKGISALILELACEMTDMGWAWGSIFGFIATL